MPFTTANEEFEPAILNHFAFCSWKIEELRDLAIRNGQGAEAPAANKELFATERWWKCRTLVRVLLVWQMLTTLFASLFAEREAIQEEAFKLPALPTTTIGPFLKLAVRS